jgi:integrase
LELKGRKKGPDVWVYRYWHTFRHSYRAWLKRTNAPMEVQQELMRHANIQTTMDTYGKETDVTDLQREAHSKVVKMILPKEEVCA